MKQENKMKTMKRSIMLMLFVALFAQAGKAQTVITVDTGMAWTAYMNVFDSVGAAYMFGSPWGLPDVKTAVDAGNGSMKLHPNFSAWDTADPYWYNASTMGGNKVMEANTYVETTTLNGQNLTFEGFVDSFTLDAAYTANAFIKVLDPANGFATVLFTQSPITAVGAFTVSDSIPNVAGLLTQYGFVVKGINADPANEAALGNVYIRGNNAPPAPPIQVTFQVQSPDSLPVYVFGSWSGWSNFPGDVMTSIGNNTYEATIQLNSGDTVEYQFVNGATPVAEALNSADPCTNGNMQFTNRMTAFGGNDTSVCFVWETCASCVPVGVDDITKDNLSILVGTKFINLKATELAQVDGIEIFNMVGKSVYSSNGKVLTNQQIPVNLQSNTLYLIRVNNGDQYHTVKTIITD